MKLIPTSFLLAGALSMAQQSNDITLNVVVKDKKNAAIKGLTAADFELTDQGNKPAKLEVRLIDADADAGHKTKLFTLVFESLDNEQRRLAKQIAYDLVKEAKGSDHYFAVVKFTNQICILQPFTTDSNAIQQAIDFAVSGNFGTAFTKAHNEVLAKLESAQDPLSRLQVGMLKKQASMDTGEASRRSVTFLDSLASGLGAHPGRKPIAYFSNGLVVPTFLDIAFEALQSRANRAGVSFYGIDCKGVGGIGESTEGGFAAESSSGEARGFGLGRDSLDKAPDDFFGIDAATEKLRSNKQANLRVLSETTGGLLIADTNNPKSLLRQMIEDTNSYYELTYDPGITTFDGSLHRTKVKTLVKDAKIRDRDGYYALKLDQQDLLPYEVRLVEALGKTPLPREFEFRSGTWKVQPGVMAAIAVEVPLSGIAFKEDTTKQVYLGRLSMMVQVKDPVSGNIVRKFTRDLPLRGKLEQLSALKNSNFSFREQVSLPAGRYVVEAVVADQLTGKIAARKTSFVGNAAPSAVGMSSVMVVRHFQPNVKDLNPEEPFQFQGGRITPTLNASLKAAKGAQMALFFIVYPEKGSTGKPEATVQYLKDGNVAGTANLQLPPPTGDRIPYVLSSPLDAMPPGMYEIKVTVKQGSGSTQESVFVTIES
jgi:VWFA-related protein